MNSCNFETCPVNWLVYNEQLNAMIPCSCYAKKIHNRDSENLFNESNIPLRYKRFLSDLENTSNSFLYANDFLKKIRDGKSTDSVYFFGQTGSGKTSLACSLGCDLMYRFKKKVFYAKVTRDFLEPLKSSYLDQSENYGKGNELEKKLQSIEVLILDEFGIGKESEWVNQKLYDLIDSRYEKNLLTIITSNVNPEFTKSVLQGRIYSRIIEMCQVINLADTKDYRLTIRSSK